MITKRFVLGAAVSLLLSSMIATTSAQELSKSLRSNVPLQQAIKQALAAGQTPSQLLVQLNAAQRDLLRSVLMLSLSQPELTEDFVVAAIMIEPNNTKSLLQNTQNIIRRDLSLDNVVAGVSQADPEMALSVVTAATELAPEQAQQFIDAASAYDIDADKLVEAAIIGGADPTLVTAPTAAVEEEMLGTKPVELNQRLAFGSQIVPLIGAGIGSGGN